MWKILLAVAAAGAVGGLLNVLLSGASVALPQLLTVNGTRVFVPGFVGNVFVGAVVAVVSYGLYGPLGGAIIIRAKQTNEPSVGALTLAALVGAVLVGFSGGRWLTAEADKQFSHQTAIAAARSAEKIISAADHPAVKASAKQLVESLQSDHALQSLERARALEDSANAAISPRK
jgi:hypothetical protein